MDEAGCLGPIPPAIVSSSSFRCWTGLWGGATRKRFSKLSLSADCGGLLPPVNAYTKIEKRTLKFAEQLRACQKSVSLHPVPSCIISAFSDKGILSR